MKKWSEFMRQNIKSFINIYLAIPSFPRVDLEFRIIKKLKNNDSKNLKLIDLNCFSPKKNTFRQRSSHNLDFYHISKYYKTINIKVNENSKSNSREKKNLKNDSNTKASIKVLNSILKKGLTHNKIIKQITYKENNLFNLYHTILQIKIVRFVIILILLYLIIFKVRLFRFTLSRIFYRISSEPKSIIYELYFGSNLNKYLKRIITEVIQDEEIQNKGTQYIIELLKEETFIRSIAKYLNHLLVKILSEERLADTFSYRLLYILRSERLNNEIKQFLDFTVKREEVRRNIMKLISYYIFRKESNDAIKQFIEYGTREILYDADLNPNLTNLCIEIFVSNIIRRRYIDVYNKHFLNDYPDEKNMQRVLDIIKQEDYIFNENFNNLNNNSNVNDQFTYKKSTSFLDKLFIKSYRSNKDKYETLYKYNNYYIDGYLSKENPNKAREKIIELGKIFKNVKFTDVEIHPHLGTFTDYDSSLGEDYFKLVMDQVMLRNYIFTNIHKTEDFYLNKFIKDKQLQDEFSLYKSKKEKLNENKNDLDDYIVNLDVNFNDFLAKHKLGQYKYKDHLYQTNDFENARFIFNPPQTKLNSYVMSIYKTKKKLK